MNADERNLNRRAVLLCLAWVGTGAILTLASGVLSGVPIEQAAHGAQPGAGGLRFVRVADVALKDDKAAAQANEALTDQITIIQLHGGRLWADANASAARRSSSRCQPLHECVSEC
jgi:hypothetical protein